MTDLFGPAGTHLLDDLELGRAYALRVWGAFIRFRS
jgi:hypothetical protein